MWIVILTKYPVDDNLDRQPLPNENRSAHLIKQFAIQMQIVLSTFRSSLMSGAFPKTYDDAIDTFKSKHFGYKWPFVDAGV